MQRARGGAARDEERSMTDDLRAAGLSRAVAHPNLDPRVPAVLLAVTALYTMVEVLAAHRSPGLGWLLQWRLLPTLLWVGASPFVAREGARWAKRDSGVARIANWTGLFLLLHTAVNVVIRLPDAPSRGLRWLVAGTVDGTVQNAPAAALLFVLLLGIGWLGQRPSAPSSSVAPKEPEAARPQVLVLPGGDRTHRVTPEQIRWLEAEGDYVRVHTTERNYLVRRSMKAFERDLGNDRFVRIHRSSLVGVDFVRELRAVGHGDYLAVLDDGTELRIPRTRRKALQRLRDG